MQQCPFGHTDLRNPIGAGWPLLRFGLIEFLDWDDGGVTGSDIVLYTSEQLFRKFPGNVFRRDDDVASIGWIYGSRPARSPFIRSCLIYIYRWNFWILEEVRFRVCLTLNISCTMSVLEMRLWTCGGPIWLTPKRSTPQGNTKPGARDCAAFSSSYFFITLGRS